MTMFPKLLQPGKIGSMEVRNRIVMSPMGSLSADSEGYISDQLIDYYAERAKGGAGLIISGVTSITPESRYPRGSCIHDDKFVPRLKELSQAVHQYGAKMAVQLCHLGKLLALMRPLFKDPKQAEEIELVGPSALPWIKTGQKMRELTKEDIGNIIEAFAEGARRTKEAGFDAVEFHGAHGYLISAFLSGFTNKRTDEYGGSLENKARFACKILSRAREKVGPNFPLILRISAWDNLPGGITLEDTLRQAPLFVKAGADALHISASGQESTEWQFLSYLYPDGAIVHLAEAVKKIVDVPVITVGKLSDPVVAERVLEQGKADFIAIGRGFLADPEIPNKVRGGRLDDIRRCIYCNNCRSATYEDRMKHGGLLCTVNPTLGREKEFALKPAASPKKVIVIGGGLAGMEAARVLAERGHQVSIYERNDRLGGQWNIVCKQRFKEGFAHVIEYLSRGMDKAGVNVILNKEVTLQFVQQLQPDAVIVATGAIPMTLDIPGVDGKNVIQAVDVITGRVKVGDNVVVIGGRLVGMETADSLAEQGKKVSIVTLHRLGENGRRVEENIYRTMRDRLIKHKVPIIPNSPVIEISDDGVYANDNGNLLFLQADTVVLAVGSRSERTLADQLKNTIPEMYMVGDCVEPRDSMVAIREGAGVARTI